jgi:hypothetical protein
VSSSTVPTVDTGWVARICTDTTTGDDTGTGAVLDVVGDPLDGTVWVRMACAADAERACTALAAQGLGAHELGDGRLHVTGWDTRLLRRRLGTLLGGVDDLSAEWDATAELTRYHHDRRVAAGVVPEAWAVLADVETVMRACVPLPHRAPQSDDITTLLDLIVAADDAYQQLIAEHITHAEHILDEHTAHQHGVA